MTNDEYNGLKGTVESNALLFFPRVSSFMTVEDVMQEGWLAATVAVARYKERPAGAASMTTFVYSAVQMAMKALTKKQKRRRGELPLEPPVSNSDEENWGSSFDDEPQMQVAADQEQALELTMLEEALAKHLTPRAALLIRLSAQGCTYEEIAQNTNMEPDAVRMALKTAREKLTKKVA